MELWRDQLLDFMAEFTGGTAATLVGNSIGGLASLMAATAAPAGSVRGLVLLNTAGAMNNKVRKHQWAVLHAFKGCLTIPALLLMAEWLTISFTCMSLPCLMM
jgi:pimeloyl-ACP methyl ester carboxylesterase